MAESLRGMPLLSGPPPPRYDPSARSEISCRKCNKEFNILFTRAKICNHCGYSYCSSCVDYQALMPRSGTESGYDAMPVCAFCVEYLTLTAGGKGYLRSQPISKLKRYVQAYNISLGADAIEKDDVVDAIIAARDSNGCLPVVNEEYYRKHSVPNCQNAKPRGFFTRNSAQTRPVALSSSESSGSWPRSQESQNFARPDIVTREQIPRQTSTRSNNPPNRSVPPNSNSTQSAHSANTNGQQQRYRPPPYPPHSHPYPPPHSHYAPRRPDPSPQHPHYSPPPNPPLYQYPPGRHSSHNLHVPPAYPPPPSQSTPQRPRSSSATSAPRATPPTPVPALDQLLSMSTEDVKNLSVATLKGILFQNHVNARMVLEKSDLVTRVMALVDDEKRERAREAAVREQEEREIIERQKRMMEELRLKEEKKRNQEQNEKSDNISTTPERTEGTSEPQRVELSPEAQAKATALERNGLCVVCQDEEANIAIVDCGHLALCRSCSDLIMSSSRECPLCRTRIITEARLLRIFKS